MACSAVATADLPVVYGHWSAEQFGMATSHPTQYRRLVDGGWIVDELDPGGSDIVPLIRPGDAWISGPTEGSLPLREAQSLAKLLGPWTEESAPCWFGIWEGCCCLEPEDLRTAAVDSPGRRWRLFRAPLAHLPRSFDPDFDHQTANLVWPDDRSWCLATGTDSEATYIGGSEELIAAILAAEDLETRAVGPRTEQFHFGSVLRPVVEKPADVVPGPGFHSRRGPRMLRPEDVERMRAWVEEQDRGWTKEWQQPRVVRALRGWWRRIGGRQGRGCGTVYRAREED